MNRFDEEYSRQSSIGNIPKVEYKKVSKPMTKEAKKAIVIATFLGIGAFTAIKLGKTYNDTSKYGKDMEYANDIAKQYSYNENGNYGVKAEYANYIISDEQYLKLYPSVEERIFIAYREYKSSEIMNQLFSVWHNYNEGHIDNIDATYLSQFSTFNDYLNSLGFTNETEYSKAEKEKWVTYHLNYDYENNEFAQNSNMKRG